MQSPKREPEGGVRAEPMVSLGYRILPEAAGFPRAEVAERQTQRT